MRNKLTFKAGLAVMLFASATLFSIRAASVRGWLHYRGPQQNGTSLESQLPGNLKLNSPTHLWTAELSGRSTPVVANGRLYVMGYAGSGPDLQELVACYDADTGEALWDHRWNDFLSDIVYTRYSTSNPTVDPDTGNVFVQGTQGIIAAFTPEGEKLWEHSMMDRFGRMTFPNGRTASPVIDGDLVITHHITAYWGGMGPSRDRFFAFNKHTGELVWLATPGGAPKDSSYSPPVLSWWNGKRVIYCGTGDGAVVCFNAVTGDPLWYCMISKGGVNAGVLLHGGKVIAVHGRENLDTSEIGRMVALQIPKSLPDGARPHEFPVSELEVWRNSRISSFGSSPILVGDTVYQVTNKGNLVAIDADTGIVLDEEDLGIEQRNAGPLYADGKLYVPMLEDPESEAAGANGAFYVLNPDPSSIDVLAKVRLEGRCFGSPAIYNGKIYVQTTEKLYCFGKPGDNAGIAGDWPEVEWPEPGEPVKLHVVPPEVLLHPGDKQPFQIRTVDKNGFTVQRLESSRGVEWESYIPPTAKVRVRMNAKFTRNGDLEVDAQAVPSVGAFRATFKDLQGVIRGRVLPDLPFAENFEAFETAEVHPANHLESGQKFAYPPLPWIGARFKFEIRQLEDGKQVLTKTIDNKLFQRGIVFLGHPDMSNYTIEADVMTEGNRRKMSEIGLICQRYYVVLKGNAGKLQINSNLERIKEETSFRMRPRIWYHLKARVDFNPDGSGIVRAKAWPVGEVEPELWTLEVKHKNAHRQGSPGLFGFAPQKILCHIDNVVVTPH